MAVLTMECAVCSATMQGPRNGYWFECAKCGYMSSNLRAFIRAESGPKAIDETARVKALGTIRRANFRRILDAIERLRTGMRGDLLDVGSGYGWFLDAAAERGYSVTGIEPDRDDAAHARHHTVIDGFFPDDLPPAARYDVITFHDVFEHLDDPVGVARSIEARLKDGGVVIVNIPNSKGVLFRIARVLNAMRIHGPFERMWQRGFPSPHRSYFHPAALAAVFEKVQLREVYRSALPSVSTTGLWSRLRFDRSMPVAASVVVWMGITLGWPILRMLPSDISVHAFQKGSRER